MSTGAYYRIRRDGRWQSVEIDQMTDGELDAMAAMEAPHVGWKWVKFLASWIRDNVHDN